MVANLNDDELKVRRRLPSRRRRALALTYGRPWHEVALEFEAIRLESEMTLADLAADWTESTGQHFSPRTVRRIIDYAKERAAQRAQQAAAGIAGGV